MSGTSLPPEGLGGDALRPADPMLCIWITIQRIIEARRPPSEAELRYLEEQMARLIALCGGQVPKTPKQQEDDSFLARFRAVLLRHIGDPRCSIRLLCQDLHTSPARLSERIKMLTGLPPKAHLRRLRLEKAAQLLRDSLAPVDAVAEQCGFSSGSHLAVRFKERYGCTPVAWRNLGGR